MNSSLRYLEGCQNPKNHKKHQDPKPEGQLKQ